jgi:M6 family metalloprotease domain
MKKTIIGLLLLSLFPLRSLAQGEELTIIKGDCMPEVFHDGDSHRASRRLPKRKTDWDASKTYKQMVVLFSFSDQDFSKEHPDPKEYYQKLFNETGFNEGFGPGCVADYYLAQSDGLLHLEFDVYGPVQVSSKAQPYDEPDSNIRNYGRESMKEATDLILEANPDLDYSQYDWDGDGKIEQVIYIYAGYPGNTSKTYGYIWPNTSSFSTITTPDGMKISNYTASGEQWPTKTPRYCGLGTICHEFTHSLGLPDIYPAHNSSIYSAVDEWDLMDGGNFTNYGWCPPNFSPLEKMLLGWLTPIELKDATTITDMKPVEEDGAVYQIKHTDTEYLLLENRQWKGWDLGIPGKGLVIYSVNFDESAWINNSVNSFSEESQFRYRLVHADNLTYDGWEDKIKEEKLNKYQYGERMNNYHLSLSSYPYQSNDSLTNTSIPAAQMQTENVAGETLLSKPITNIQILDDGIVSFEFNEATLLLVEGNESSDGGMVSKSTTVTEGKKTLTIIPNKDYYVEAKNISVLARDLLTGEKDVDITALDVSADPSGTTQYTYPYEEGYGYQIIVDFQKCIDFSNDETKPVITLEATSFEYDGTKKEPAVLSVIYGDGVLVDESNYDVTYEDNIEIGDAKAIITGKRCFIGECSTTFTIKEAAGINTVRQSVDDEGKGIYDLQGRPVQTPMSGQVYIIRKKDGTTRKQIHVDEK